MTSRTKRLSALLVSAAFLSIPLLAAEGERVKQVNPKNICFVNKTRFIRTLESVKVDGRAHYGCCKDCLTKLVEDPNARLETDPVSGNPVDKAVAVIGVDKDGKIYFFESKENLRKFRTPAKSEAAIPTGER